MTRSVVLCIAAVLAILLMPAAALPAAPGATTGTASDVTATTATLNGVGNPNKEDTVFFFEYGTTTAYGGRTPDQGNDATFTTAAAAYTLPPPPANTVTIGAVPTLLSFGRSTVIAGQVTGSGNAGVTVDLQSSPHPFPAGFKNTGLTTRTDATGRYTFTVRPGAHTRYQVVAKASPPVTSPAVEVRVRFAVALKANDHAARRDQRIMFSGNVRPAHDGRTVRIQRRRSNGTWRTIARTTLRRSTVAGRSTYTKRLRVYRTAVYRVRVSADADHATGTSRKRRVRVG